MVISEKHKVTRMNGDTVGFGGEYDIKDVPHAMRLTTSGTFIHGNYWARPAPSATATPATAASACATCAAAATSGTPAAWFFNNSIIGDVVIVKNSKDETIQPGQRPQRLEHVLGRSGRPTQ